MDIRRLLEDHDIPISTTGRHLGSGNFLATRCPFCRDESDHLGISPTGACFCWRCGNHPLIQTLSKILRLDENTVKGLIRDYGGRSRSNKSSRIQGDTGVDPFILPSLSGPMDRPHTSYLTSRNFDPDKLAAEWGLLGTGPISRLDHISFKHRIIAPIMWDGRMVSFQARDITNKQELRYITCPRNREVVHHKHIVYGKQEEWVDVGICVEGITDVWRLGPRAFATFGIEFTREQAIAIQKAFRYVVILFDNEPHAQKQAEKLQGSLQGFGVKVRIVTVADDPGSMEQDDADYLVKELSSIW